MSFKFEKLKVWQLSRKYAVRIYQVTSGFPSVEKFSLIDQLRRAGNSDKEFTRFLRIAIGSMDEVVTGLYIAKDLGYLNEGIFEELYKEANIIVKKINALIRSIK
jgi:four helix bundle protein